MDKTNIGWIYMLENESFPDLIKIGFTSNDPIQRAQQLSTTGVPTPFKVIYRGLVNDPQELEREVHEELAEYRNTGNREFFQIDPNYAYDTIHALGEIMQEDVDFEVNDKGDGSYHYEENPPNHEDDEESDESIESENHFFNLKKALMAGMSKLIFYEQIADNHLINEERWESVGHPKAGEAALLGRDIFDIFHKAEEECYDLLYKDGEEIEGDDTYEDLRNYCSKITSIFDSHIKEIDILCENFKKEPKNFEPILKKGERYENEYALKEIAKRVRRENKEESIIAQIFNPIMESIRLFHSKVDPFCKKVEKASLVTSAFSFSLGIVYLVLT